MSTKSYTQVLLQHDSSTLVGWIESKLAVKGKVVQILDEGDDRHWLVSEVYTTRELTPAEVAEQRHKHTWWRESVDI